MLLDILLKMKLLTIDLTLNAVQFSRRGARARLSIISVAFLEDLYPVVPAINSNNATLLCYSDTTRIFKATFIFAKRTKRAHKLAISIKHLDSVVVVIAHQDVIFIIAGHTLRTVKQAVL